MAYNFYEIELKEALRPAITYAISDLKNPDARKAEFSKTITLPSSKKLDKLFNHIFEINVETLSFNPNKRLEVEYFADEQSQLRGYLKLDEIVILDNNDVNYKVSIFGKNSDLFSNIGEKELTDLTGLDTYNHPWSRSIIQDSWDNTIRENGIDVSFSYGKGYVYPLIEYGFDQFTNPPTWDVVHLFPAIYAKEYVDRIFTDAGKTYTSNFFNSATFKRLIVPFNGTDIFLSDDQINDRVIKVDTASQSIGTSWQTVVFTNEVLDNDNNYDNTTGVYTIPERGYYDFTTVLDLRAIFTPIGNLVPVTLNRFVSVEIGIFVNGSLSGAINNLYLGDETVTIASGGSYDTGATVAYPSDAHSTNIIMASTTGAGSVSNKTPNYNDPASNCRLSRNELLLSASDTVEIKVKYNLNKVISIAPIGTPDSFIDFGSFAFYDGTHNVTVESGKLTVNVTKASVEENGTIDIYQAVPKEIKQKDFLKSIMNMFRLEIQPNPNQLDDYIIEPYDNFYSNTGVNWSQKLDVSQDLVFEPMGLLEASEYLYKYKDDKDYYNETYKGEYTETYGQRSGLIDNDFVKKLHTTELIFSPTPSVQYPGVDLILPTIIKNEDTYKQTESNIRILYYGGLQSTQSVWSIYSEVANNTEDYTSYPYAGHFSDPYTPSIDINFGLPKRLYYDSSFADIEVTNNNLFNAYHLPFLKQVAQRDSKLVSGYFYLKPEDISGLDFRLAYFFNNAYHRLIRVENYDPNKPLTKCYFLKILSTTPFESIQEWANGGKEDIGGKEDGVDIEETLPELKRPQRTGRNYGKQPHKIQGKDNYVDDQAKNIKIQGDNNYVGANVSNVNLTNSNNNNIIGGVTNVTLINTDGANVTESNVFYINGELIYGGGAVVEKNANFEASNAVRYYEVDTSAGNVVISFGDLQEGKIWNFKKMTAANQMEIKPTSPMTIDDQTSLVYSAQYTNVKVMFDGEQLIII